MGGCGEEDYMFEWVFVLILLLDISKPSWRTRIVLLQAKRNELSQWKTRFL